MKSLTQRLSKLVGRVTGGESSRCAWMFGKHPLRADHWQVGTPLAAAARLRTVLYGGIEQSVGAGRWEQLDAAAALPGFAHLLVARLGRTMIASMISASVDRTGTRSSYPLVCSVAGESRLPRQTLLGLAADMDRAIRAATDEDAVSAAIVAAQTALDQLTAEPETSKSGGPDWTFAELHRLVADPDQPDAVLRTAWAIEQRFGPALRREVRHRETDGTLVPPIGLRFRRSGTDPIEQIAAWSVLLETIVSSEQEFWVYGPIERGWTDVVLGTPSPDEIFLLRATTEHRPTAGNVPTRGIDPLFREHIESRLRGPNADRDAPATDTPGTDLSPSSGEPSREE